MPLYEFYCEPCHTVYTFRSTKVNTSSVPPCPVCGAALKREVSPFAHTVGGTSPAGTDSDELAQAKEEDLIAKMSDRMEGLDSDDADPSQAVKTMREMAKTGGLKFNKDVEEAFQRIESGEDPEKIDEEFKEVFDETHNPFDDKQEGAIPLKPSELWRRLHAPRHDPKWYDM